MTNTNYYETNEPLQQYGQVFFLSVSLAINIKFVIQWNSHTQRDKTEYMQANQSPPTPYSESLNLWVRRSTRANSSVIRIRILKLIKIEKQQLKELK